MIEIIKVKQKWWEIQNKTKHAILIIAVSTNYQCDQAQEIH